MITIHQFPPAHGLPVSASPFCTKLEVYLRLAGHEYDTAVGDVRKSPTKTVPYVSGLDGDAFVADSREIIRRLEHLGPTLDEGISEADTKLGRELEAEAEQHLYFACLSTRFVNADGWAHQKPVVKALVPALLTPVITPMIRKSQVKKCREAGFPDGGGFDHALKTLDRIEETLGDWKFLFGDAPRVGDCSVWANLVHNAYDPVPSPVRDKLRSRHMLLDYIDRVAEKAKLELPKL